MKAKQRTLLILLAVIFVLGGAFALLSAQNEKAELAASEAANGAISLLSVSSDDLTEFRVTYNGETNTFRYADGSWTLAEAPTYHLDTTACNSMLTALSALNAKRQLTEEPGEEYGFDGTELTVTVTAAGETITLYFGAENEMTGDVYLKKEGDDALYTVASSKKNCFALSRAELFGAFNPAGLTTSAIEAIQITKPDGSSISLKAVSESVVSEADSESESDSTEYQTVWRLTDEQDTALDDTAVNGLLSALSSYVSAQDTAPDLNGMKTLAEAAVTTADGMTELTYLEGTDGYYLKVEGDDSLYTIDGDTVQTVLTTKEALTAVS